MTTTTTAILTDFAGETLPGRDAEILTAEYGQFDQAKWRDDAEALATAALNHILPDGAAVSTEPWMTLFLAIESRPREEIEDAIYDALNGSLQGEVRAAVYSYLSLMIHHAATRYQAMKLGAQANPNKQKRITSRLIESPDAALKRQIENELIPDKRPAIIRHQNIEALLVDWLARHGKFVRSEDNYYYLYHDDHKLYDLETERWQAFLHTLTGVNPAMSGFGLIVSGAKTAANNHAETVPVVKFSHYDRDTRTLRVSRFDGVVYVLDGQTITTETNGDGPVLFYDFPSWQPYDLGSGGDYLNELAQIPHWKNEPDLYSWVFQVWAQTLFFTELCPTRPIIMILGEKGSGKSMALRLLMKLLFGQFADVSGVPEKPDALSVAAHYYHLYVMDNMDTLEPWMRDKLARISTGATDEYRKLFTSKEMGIIRYRTWLAITARTPDTLRRDDLADRVIILPLKRIPDDQRGRELEFTEWVEQNRSGFWFEMLTRLNRIVAQLRGGSIPLASPLRMADWEALGRVISEMDGKTDLWDRLVEMIRHEQHSFLADGEVIIEAIEAWLINPINLNRWVTARELYTESQELLFGASRPDSDWPRSVRSFGWRLKNIADYLKTRFGMKTVDVRGGAMVKYSFEKN